MARQTWHDINSPGTLGGTPTNSPGQANPVTGVGDSSAAQRQPPPVEYRIASVKAVKPPHGFELRKPFDIEGSVERIMSTITQPRVLLYPVGIYKSDNDQFAPNGVEAFIDQSTNTFRGTCTTLYESDHFARDAGKPADATWQLVIRAEGRTAQAPAQSDPITFPQETHFIELRRSDYDDNGGPRYSKPLQQDGSARHTSWEERPRRALIVLAL